MNFQFLRPRRDVLVFLVFLVLSGLFWLSTELNGYYDYEVDIPIEVTAVPTSLIRTTDDVDIVHVTIYDKGFALLQYVREKKMDPIVLNYSTYKKPGNKCMVSATELSKMVAKKFPNSTMVKSIKPDKIELSFVEGVGRSVPVRVVGDLEPAKDYYLEHIEVKPSNVTLYAPQGLKDSTGYVETETLHLRDFSDTLKTMVKLKTQANTKAVPSEVEVTLFPDILTEEEVEVPINVTNVPQGVTLRTFPSRVKVKFTIGASLYRTINVSQFEVVADYNDIVEDAEKCCISLTQTPKGVKGASLEVDEVDYLIENYK